MLKCSFTRRRARNDRAQELLSIEEEVDGEDVRTKEAEVVDRLL